MYSIQMVLVYYADKYVKLSKTTKVLCLFEVQLYRLLNAERSIETNI